MNKHVIIRNSESPRNRGNVWRATSQVVCHSGKMSWIQMGSNCTALFSPWHFIYSSPDSEGALAASGRGLVRTGPHRVPQHVLFFDVFHQVGSGRLQRSHGPQPITCGGRDRIKYRQVWICISWCLDIANWTCQARKTVISLHEEGVGFLRRDIHQTELGVPTLN